MPRATTKATSLADGPTLACTRDYWILRLRSDGKSDRTISTYLRALDRLDAFLVERGMLRALGAVRREHLEVFSLPSVTSAMRPPRSASCPRLADRSARSRQCATSACLAGELSPGADAKLAVGVGQVVLDRLGVTNRAWATSRLVRPCAAKRATRPSAGVGASTPLRTADCVTGVAASCESRRGLRHNLGSCGWRGDGSE